MVDFTFPCLRKINFSGQMMLVKNDKKSDQTLIEDSNEQHYWLLGLVRTGSSNDNYFILTFAVYEVRSEGVEGLEFCLGTLLSSVQYISSNTFFSCN